jgi:hypothetical protein
LFLCKRKHSCVFTKKLEELEEDQAGGAKSEDGVAVRGDSMENGAFPRIPPPAPVDIAMS